MHAGLLRTRIHVQRPASVPVAKLDLGVFVSIDWIIPVIPKTKQQTNILELYYDSNRMTAGHKTPEELEQERVAAQKQLNDLLSQMSSAPASKPKNLQQGLSAGVSHIVSGAVGAAGVAVIAPVAGLAVGTATGGLLGGVVGVAGGAVVGAVGAVAIAASSAVAGVVQIVRGVAAIPQSVTAHRSGKWWNEAENGGKWVFTDMDKEKDLYIKGVPLDDSDILGAVQQELDATNEEMRKSTKTMTTVKDMEYYECLQASSDAEPSQLKRQYYLLARKYHPDKTDDPADAEKFKDIAEAYQVLSDPALRKKYDTEGKDGLSPDKTDASGSNTHGVDPALLFSFLFGSDQFDAYVGRVSMATAASVGDSPKITHAQARLLQKRRVTRLAASLIDKIDPWVAASMAAGTNENKEESDAILKDIEAAWELEAKELTKASFGHQLVLTIGKV